MIKVPPLQRGKLAEKAALAYLKKHGLKELACNFNSRFGEIDLIMLDKTTIVFIEVRSRANNRFMTAIETIDNRKIQKILRTSHHFLQQQSDSFEACRFDIVTLTGNIRSPRIDWIKNAFTDD